MLQRVQSADGMVYYVSPLLRAAGVPHAFSTRIGGVSPPPFDSLNFGNPNGCAIQDDTDRIRENYRRLQRASGCDGNELCRVHQVHGSTIVRAQIGEPFDISQKADGIVTDDPSRVISVRVADCVPVLLATADGKAVAAVHAGWRGVVANIVAEAVRELRQVARETPLIAAIGPSIGFDAFEVGPEVLAEFAREFGAAAPAHVRVDGKGNVDLKTAIQRQLLQLGFPPGQIDMTDRCTVKHSDEFFSHRRDFGVTGRMTALISPAVASSAAAF